MLTGASTAILAAAEPLLVAVVALLVLVIAGLIALALLLRRRSRIAEPVAAPVRTEAAPPPAQPIRARPRPRPLSQLRRAGAGGGLAVATSSAMVCPSCRTEFHGLTYCTRDARRLVLPEEMIGGPLRAAGHVAGKSAGVVCMACHRAFEPGVRACPHDATELVPFSVYNATRPRRRGATEPAGVIARICPLCGAKYDLNARFCGHDAGELVVIN